ncbi:MAG: CoA transferase [Deltaproteobacteria bacterium]|nr:CoA transferase [Deltaproteobacteria bacterium]MBI3295999.1 CoA transferase [Deltaproteobacteria bacterium]
MEMWSDEQERPLQHIRVVDLTIMVPGPYITRLLAQYGADVIKIEHLPNGDPLRHVKESNLFELLNQGKRSVALDLGSDKGIEIVKRLASESDLFIENFRSGVMDRFGLGYSHLSEENADILYASIRGMAGEHESRAAHDFNFIANSGCGEWFLEDGAPNYSTNFGDIVGGALVPLTKLLMHLANPARHGMHLVSHMDEGFRSLYLHRAWDALSPRNQTHNNFGLHSLLDGKLPHSRYYRCRDGGWIALNAIQAKHWEIFCKAVDRAEWIPRMNDPQLVPDLDKLFMDAPSNYWEVLTKGQEACLFRVIPWNDHVAGSDVRAKMSSDPFTWAGFTAAGGDLKPCPTFGQDTFAVLHGTGLDNKSIAELIQSGTAK